MNISWWRCCEGVVGPTHTQTFGVGGFGGAIRAVRVPVSTSCHLSVLCVKLAKPLSLGAIRAAKYQNSVLVSFLVDANLYPVGVGTVSHTSEADVLSLFRSH